MIKNFLKLFSNEFKLMLKGSVFSIVLYCLVIIACSIFALSLRHKSLGADVSLSFLYIMIFFISLFKVENIYSQDFAEAKLYQYILSPFSLELIIFVKNIMIYFNLIVFFFIFSPLIFIILSIDLSYLLKVNILIILSLLSVIFISSITASITISKNNRLSITSILTLPLFVPVLIISVAITDLIDFNTYRMYSFFIAYFLLNLALSPLLTSFALKKLSS